MYKIRNIRFFKSE